MKRGPIRRWALGMALLPFCLLVYLLVSSKGSVIVQILLILVFAALMLRGVGLKKASADADATTGRISLATEFEGPETEDERDD